MLEKFNNKKKLVLYHVNCWLSLYDSDFNELWICYNTIKLEKYLYSYNIFFKLYKELYYSIPDYIDKQKFIIYTINNNIKIKKYIITILNVKKHLDSICYNKKINDINFDNLINDLYTRSSQYINI